MKAEYEVISIKKALELSLTENNHLLKNKHLFNELLVGKYQDYVYNHISLELWFNEWYNEYTAKDESGEYLSILLYKGYWIPYEEYKILSKLNVSNYKIGYINGRKSHLGPFETNTSRPDRYFHAYVLWIEFNQKECEKL